MPRDYSVESSLWGIFHVSSLGMIFWSEIRKHSEISNHKNRLNRSSDIDFDLYWSVWSERILKIAHIVKLIKQHRFRDKVNYVPWQFNEQKWNFNGSFVHTIFIRSLRSWAYWRSGDTVVIFTENSKNAGSSLMGELKIKVSYIHTNCTWICPNAISSTFLIPSLVNRWTWKLKIGLFL